MENEENDDLMDFLDTSKFLKVSPNTLRQKYKEWELPFLTVGRNIRFSRIAVWKWLHTVRANHG
jgi:excisionase family DNA binding protein